MKISILLFIFAFICNDFIYSQAQQKNLKASQRGDLRIMFYNVENLFDTIDNPKTMDEDFLPQGGYRWNGWKLWKKLGNTCKIVTAVGGWDAPEIVGFCEVECRSVLDMLVQKTNLKRFNYQVVHKESPDPRGIDVALMYRKDKIIPITYEAINVSFLNDSAKTTRDILYFMGKTLNGDTINIFVNHWPSRRGGQMESEQFRVRVAEVVKEKVDQIFKLNSSANIILIGDFNDYPDNYSLIKTLEAKIHYDTIENSKLYNLSYYLHEKTGLGTHKHMTEWGILDQIIVSGNLLNTKTSLRTSLDDAHIYKEEFLLMPDKTNLGYKPFRTYEGMKYLGGYSDHLPVYLDLYSK